MKAYKVFNHDWTCQGHQYEIGKTYTFDGELKLCPSAMDIEKGMGGFHTCRHLSDCFTYYDCVPWNKIAQVEMLGDIKSGGGGKQVTNKIKILKEIPFKDIGKFIISD